MSTADKLNKLLETKQAIKQAIIDKGVEVADDTPFADYPSKIDSIEGGGANPFYEEIYNLITDNNTDYSYLFDEHNQLTELDLSNWNTSNVTNMRAMFYNCESLTSLDVSNWDISNVATIYSMFNSCRKLTQLDVSKWNTSNVTDMTATFKDCKLLTELDVSNWDTGNVTDMYSTFSGCSNLTSLDVSNWDTSNVTTMYTMFSTCSKLTELNVSNWDTSNVTTMYMLFYGCSLLTQLDLSNWNTSNVTNTGNMFYNCTSLTTLNLSNFDAGKVTSIGKMFDKCTSLHTLRLDNCSNDTINKIITSSGFPTNAIEGIIRTIYCKEENAADLTPPANWEFSFISIPEEDPDYINSGNPYIEARFDTQYQGHMNGESGYQWKYSFDGISWHDNDDCSYNEEEDIYNGATTEGNETIYFRPNNEQIGEDIGMYRLFENANGLMEAEFHNMENIIIPISPYMDHMFENTRITNVDLSWINSDEIRNVDFMFSGCSLLETVDIRNLNIVNEGYEGDSESEITDMFASCDNLREIRLDDCSNDTISMIVNSQGFPTGAIDDVTRTIYCKESEAAGLEVPENWVFSYVDSYGPGPDDGGDGGVDGSGDGSGEDGGGNPGEE